jgi:hypothetical protein
VGHAERGLTGVRLIISDACLGLIEAAGEVFPQAAWQHCVVILSTPSRASRVPRCARLPRCSRQSTRRKAGELRREGWYKGYRRPATHRPWRQSVMSPEAGTKHPPPGLEEALYYELCRRTVLTVSAPGIPDGRPGTASRSDQLSGLRASISTVCGTSGVVSHSSEVTR